MGCRVSLEEQLGGSSSDSASSRSHINLFLHRWLFYIEGSLTIAVAIAAIFILPDFPTTTRWLSPLERRLAMKRMAEDGGIGIGDQEETEPSKVRAIDQKPSFASGFWLAVSDWKVWWLTLALTSEVTALSFNAFFPTLSATLGFNRTVTLVLVAPPFILTAILAFLISRYVLSTLEICVQSKSKPHVFVRHSDKTGERFYHITIPLLIGILGFVIAISTMNTAARYVSLFVYSMSYKSRSTDSIFLTGS